MARGRKQAAADTGPVEGPWDLPDGWRWERLGCLADVIRGVSYGRQQVSTAEEPGKLPLLRGGNLQNGTLWLDDLLFVDQACVSDDQFLRERDIVLTMSSGSPALIGKSAWVPTRSDNMTFGAFCGCLRSKDTAMARWLFWFLQTPFYRQAITASAKGTNINNLKREHLLVLPVAVPPPDLQASIVARIDALFTEIDEGETALAEARAGVETYRKALLKAAVSGELTADWRRANPPRETGEQLLQRILADRRTRWHADPRNKGRKYAAPVYPETDGLPELPDSWTWGSIDQLCSHITSGSRAWSQYYDQGSSVFIMAQNVRPGRFDDRTCQLVGPPRDDPERRRTRVIKNDLLLTIVGANTGDLCQVRFDPADHYVCQSVALLRPEVATLGNVIELFYSTPFGRGLQMDRMIYGAGRPHLSFEDIRKLAVPVPPAEEVQAVVAAADTAMAHIPSAESLEVAATSVATLRQSILAAAFRGELAA